MTLVMMRMRVGLQHELNDPVGLIYTRVIFSLICRPMYITKYWLQSHGRISLLHGYYTRNDDLQPLQIVNTSLQQLYHGILVLSRSLRKQDILAQFIVRKQYNDG